MDVFPLFAKLKGAPCLVVGGGSVAQRKVLHLLQAGAAVTVNAPDLSAELTRLAASGSIKFHAGPFAPDLIAAHLLIVAATDDRSVNLDVAAAARRAQRLCNVVDDGEASGFIMPSVVDRSPLLVAVSSGGTSPALARMVRQRIDEWLPARMGELAGWARRWRKSVRAHLPSLGERLRFWENMLAGPAASYVLAGQGARADDVAKRALAADGQDGRTGQCWLVGAGPGDPDLITRRGLQCLQQADVVLYDRLVGRALLDLARKDAEFICVGKQAGGPSWAQDDINRTLVELVHQGKRVCRLKGGDPFVFGRGGEELAALAEAGLPYQVVPGITAATGCGAYAGIPLTHRDLAGSVTLLTAQRAKGQAAINWANLASPDQTLVFYMGTARLEDIAAQLVAAGRAPDTPAAIVENGTTPNQRVVNGNLQTITECSREAEIKTPAVLIVGEVAGLAERSDQSGTETITGAMTQTAH